MAVVKFGYSTEQVLGCFLVVGEQIPKLQLFLLYYSLKIPPHLGAASQSVLLFLTLIHISDTTRHHRNPDAVYW